MKIYFIVIVSLLYTSFVFSDQEITHYTIQGQIYTISNYQDYIWCGTSDGLVRINRHNFHQEVFKPSTGSTYFSIVEVGPDGTVWIVIKSSFSIPGNGIITFDGENWNYFQNKIYSFTVDSKNRIWTIREEMRNPIPNSHYVEYHQLLQMFDGYEWKTIADIRNDMNPFVCLALDEKTNTVWLGAFENNYKITVSDDSTHIEEFRNKYYYEDDVPENVGSIAIDSSSVPWFLTPDKLYTYKDETWIEDPVEYEKGGVLFIDRNDIIWISTGNGLIRYDRTDSYLYTTHDGLIHNIVHSITEDDDGNLWLATPVGWSKFDGETFDSINYSVGLRSNSIRDIFVDSSNAKWIGTSKGIDIFDGESWKYYSENDGLIPRQTSDITEAPDGTFWISQKSVISHYDGDTWITYNDVDFGTSRVEQIFVDSKNNVWTLHGKNYVSQFNGDIWEQFDFPVGQISYSHGMVCDNNDKLWIIIRDNKNIYYLYNFSDDHEWIEKTPEDVYEIYAVAKDYKNRIWLNGRIKESYKSALLYYDRGRWNFETFLPDEKKPSRPVTTVMAVDYTNKVWLGTEKSGVMVYDGESWINHTVSTGSLPDSEISDIAVDRNNTVWVGTLYEGLVSIKQDNIHVDQESTPSELLLLPNFPNPFNASTTLSFKLNKTGDVTFDIYNISGQKIRELITEILPAGIHNVV